MSRPRFRTVAAIDPGELSSFRAALRRRYSDAQILAELRKHASRTGRSPTMKEFAADPLVAVHPQTVIEHFGSWNAAKRAAGLVPRRYATREELLSALRALGEELGRIPTARDLDERRGGMPSKSLYWHTFGSFSAALREAGYPVEDAQERLERALEQGCALAGSLGRLPKFTDWSSARRSDASLLSEWQIYRMFEERKGAWAIFQFLIRRRLLEQGARVRADGAVELRSGRGGDRSEAGEAEVPLVRRPDSR